MKIIVIEDEIRSREGLIKLIKKLNPSYQIIGEAENGLDGLQLIKSQRPDLIITDIKMPVMDGLSMLAAMREINIDSKIIIISAFADFSYAQQAITFGVSEYLLKPISVGNLSASLEKFARELDKPLETPPSNISFSPLIQRVYKILNEPSGLSLSLNEISHQLKVTPEYLGSQFHKETGLNFSNYIKNKRIEQAKILLQNTSTKISAIATLLGYNDSKYFSKLFKKETGLLPVEYRRNQDNLS